MKGQKYKHINSGRLYEVVDVGLLKENGVWGKVIVSYQSLDDGVVWFRLKEDFLKKFKIDKI